VAVFVNGLCFYTLSRTLPIRNIQGSTEKQIKNRGCGFIDVSRNSPSTTFLRQIVKRLKNQGFEVAERACVLRVSR
jgi:hypothetical protein